ncbi:tetratricopeptide repeat protein [Luteimonas sp. SDU82]|uniref:tetratricopeptide repeat protein n=1 Tax=Luteimonas sp. SDU82 TaxID=3422592 RepID=UPI003EB71722
MHTISRALAHAGLLGLFILLSAPVATAQSLPRPAEFYFDEDSAARPIVAIEGDDDATVAQLVRHMERGGRNADQAMAQLAHLSMVAGRTETGMALYARALQSASAGSQRRRALQWNQAWDLYRHGEVERALGLWAEAGSNSVVRYAWVPPTLALALWKLDRRSEAVTWYAAAVRTYPDRWSNPGALAALLPDWSDADRAILADVLAAWREDPPAWP